MKANTNTVPQFSLKLKKSNIVPMKITCSTDLDAFFTSVYSKIEMYRETVTAIYLDSANNTIGYEIHSIGGLSGCMVDRRLILSTALTSGAVSIAICHNHPSGNLTPSEGDKNVTRELLEAAKTLDIRFLDHIIISENGYYSFADHGLI